MSDKCRKVGHNYQIEYKDNKIIGEKCADCGRKRWWPIKEKKGQREDYMREHARDIIQPSDKEKWELAYGKRQ